MAKRRITASLVGLAVTSLAQGCATAPVTPPQARLVAELNRGQRSRTALYELVDQVPFGESLLLTRYRLGNGLTVLVLVDASAPVISYQTWFKVGSRNEHEGKTGLAHLFEHLMFNETEHLAAGEFDRQLESAGGETNAATWVDWTYFYENVPRDSLPLVARLEADRMSHLVLRDPQVSSEKDVVINERAMRVDDDVEGSANEELYKLAFRTHPYHWPTIGWRQDIEGFTTADCRAFYRTYYAPNNATIVLAGDVDEEAALRVIRENYGRLRPARLPEEAPVAEPAQRAERRLTMRRPTPTEKLQLGYRAPAFGEYDHAVLTILNEILLGGRSSRLYRALVSEGELAAETRGAVAPFRDAGLYEIWVSMREGHESVEALAVIEAESARLRDELVSDAELDKAKNRLELGFLQGMETASGKAEQIGFYETVLGDPARVFGRLEEVRRVTAADVQRVARRVLEARRRTTVIVLPDGTAEPDAADSDDGADDSAAAGAE